MEPEDKQELSEITAEEFYSKIIINVSKLVQNDRDTGIKILEYLKTGATKYLRTLRNESKQFPIWDDKLKAEQIKKEENNVD